MTTTLHRRHRTTSVACSSLSPHKQSYKVYSYGGSKDKPSAERDTREMLKVELERQVSRQKMYSSDCNCMDSGVTRLDTSLRNIILYTTSASS